MANSPAAIVARELAKVPSVDRLRFLSQLADAAFAGIIVIEGAPAAVEKAYMLADAIVQQGEGFGETKK
jgi:hypothetical protein